MEMTRHIRSNETWPRYAQSGWSVRAIGDNEFRADDKALPLTREKAGRLPRPVSGQPPDLARDAEP